MRVAALGALVIVAAGLVACTLTPPAAHTLQLSSLDTKNFFEVIKISVSPRESVASEQLQEKSVLPGSHEALPNVSCTTCAAEEDPRYNSNASDGQHSSYLRPKRASPTTIAVNAPQGVSMRRIMLFFFFLQ